MYSLLETQKSMNANNFCMVSSGGGDGSSTRRCMSASKRKRINCAYTSHVACPFSYYIQYNLFEWIISRWSTHAASKTDWRRRLTSERTNQHDIFVSSNATIFILVIGNESISSLAKFITLLKTYTASPRLTELSKGVQQTISVDANFYQIVHHQDPSGESEKTRIKSLSVSL